MGVAPLSAPAARCAAGSAPASDAAARDAAGSDAGSSDASNDGAIGSGGADATVWIERDAGSGPERAEGSRVYGKKDPVAASESAAAAPSGAGPDAAPDAGAGAASGSYACGTDGIEKPSGVRAIISRSRRFASPASKGEPATASASAIACTSGAAAASAAQGCASGAAGRPSMPVGGESAVSAFASTAFDAGAERSPALSDASPAASSCGCSASPSTNANRLSKDNESSSCCNIL